MDAYLYLPCLFQVRARSDVVANREQYTAASDPDRGGMYLMWLALSAVPLLASFNIWSTLFCSIFYGVLYLAA